MKRLLFMAAMVCSMVSCSMMHDDQDQCPDGLYVQFVYDYNIQRADMFKDHVGGVTVFVFNDKGFLVKKQSVANTAADAPLKTYGYKMHIEGLTPGKYQLLALANQKDYESTLKTKGAKYRWSDIQVGDSMSALSVALDNESAADANGCHFVNNDGAAMDTLWHGRQLHLLEVKSNEPTYDTISLVRDTKHLNITLRQTEDKDKCPIEDYDIYIIDRNGKLLYDNSVAEGNDLKYTPYATWNTYFNSDGTSGTSAPVSPVYVVEQIAHADLCFNRLMYRDLNDRPAMLYIYNNKNKVLVAKINLADCLAQARTSFEMYNYSPQEFLDREYNYKLEFFLVGDRWQYVNLSISALPWVKRIQNETL